MALAPIILFIYNRPDHTKQTLEALSNSILAPQSDLFIFADGPKNTASKEQLESIKQTRKVAASEKWCKSVTLIESETNKGLARSIIEGVTEIINKFGKVIVLEDDLVTGKYFRVEGHALPQVFACRSNSQDTTRDLCLPSRSNAPMLRAKINK